MSDDALFGTNIREAMRLFRESAPSAERLGATTPGAPVQRLTREELEALVHAYRYATPLTKLGPKDNQSVDIDRAILQRLLATAQWRYAETEDATLLERSAVEVAIKRLKEFFTEQRGRIVSAGADNRAHNYLERVGYSLEQLASAARTGIEDRERPAVVIEWDIRNPLPEKQVGEMLARFAQHLPPTFEQWEKGHGGDVEYPIIEISVRARSGRSPSVDGDRG